MNTGDYTWSIKDIDNKTYLIISEVDKNFNFKEIYKIDMDYILIEYDHLGYDT